MIIKRNARVKIMHHIMLFIESIWRSMGKMYFKNEAKESFLIREIIKVARRVDVKTSDQTRVREFALSVVNSERTSVETNRVNPHVHIA